MKKVVPEHAGAARQHSHALRCTLGYQLLVILLRGTASDASS
jgi:hypothetical protein